jgi:hypothetical protein
MYGTIVGNVSDSSGALIGGAVVNATEVQTNQSRIGSSNSEGRYTLATLPPGTYRISISKAGFGKFDAENIRVLINTIVRVDAALTVDSVKETVQVSSETTELQTDSSDVHGEITARSFADLPQPTRTYEGLLGLLPGVDPPTASAGGTNNPARSMAIESNGTSQSGTDVRIDGVSAVNPWVQYFSTAVPATEALETVNAVTSTPEADQGLAGGMAINVQIKSGTNGFHGSVYEYHEDNALEARPYFQPQGTRLPKLIDNDFGFTLGGPIMKNRLFFFGSYEGDITRNGSSDIVTVPTADMRQGIMTASPTPIYDPSTGGANGVGRTPFPNNTLTGKISSISAKLVALIPMPNIPGAGISNNYFVNTPTVNQLHKIDTKFNWTATNKYSMVGRLSFYPYNETRGTIFGDVLAGNHNHIQNGDIYAFSVSGTYVATSSLVLNATFGLTHSSQNFAPPGTSVRYGSDILGIPGTNLGDLPTAGGMPQFNVDGFSPYGYNYPALVYNDPIFQYTGDGTWSKGRHTVRFGMDISQQHMNHSEVNPTQFTFTGGATQLNGGPAANQFNSFADFLLGLPINESNSYQAEHWATLRTWQFSPYVSDQFQFNKRLTATIGTRWEYFPVPTRSDRGIEYYDLTNNTYNICGKGPNSNTCGISVQKILFSPRVGLAYRPLEKTVVRGGFSLSPEQMNMYREGLYSYPMDISYYGNGPDAYTPAGTLAEGIPVTPVVDTSSGVISLPSGATFITDPKHFIRGYVESYNVTVEQDLGHDWFATIAYVGTHSVHGHTNYNINYGLPGGGAASQPFYQLNGTTGPETVISPLETMHYNSLQATATHRLRSGYQLGASYTWSKWMGLCCDANGDNQPAIAIPQYFNLNRSVMPGDITHIFNLSAVMESPFGRNKHYLTNGIGAALAGGWQLNAILGLHTGLPFSVAADGTSLNAPGNTQRADQVKSHVAILGGIGPHPWFDTTAFAAVTGPRFGTASFDSLRGPGFADLDLGLFRNFTLKGESSLQIRAEALNTTNTPHFGNPDGYYGDGSFGQISSVDPGSRLTDQRYFRVGAKVRF